ncbi:hypothetical protein M272_20920 [Vibrio natriegens NBRC 15636 = ATCC 14048 = DSM 759]|nr:hypothetical protein M272_20920 [Vibrio natriegens NBRC 15636 = ATCC 14048 = DSM 759]
MASERRLQKNQGQLHYPISLLAKKILDRGQWADAESWN